MTKFYCPRCKKLVDSAWCECTRVPRKCQEAKGETVEEHLLNKSIEHWLHMRNNPIVCIKNNEGPFSRCCPLCNKYARPDKQYVNRNPSINCQECPLVVTGLGSSGCSCPEYIRARDAWNLLVSNDTAVPIFLRIVDWESAAQRMIDLLVKALRTVINNRKREPGEWLNELLESYDAVYLSHNETRELYFLVSRSFHNRFGDASISSVHGWAWRWRYNKEWHEDALKTLCPDDFSPQNFTVVASQERIKSK